MYEATNQINKRNEGVLFQEGGVCSELVLAEPVMVKNIEQ
jgi:hypothetical protein